MRARRFLVGLVIVGAVASGAPAEGPRGFVVPVFIGNVTTAVATPVDRASVLGFLHGYEATMASGRVERIVALYADFNTARTGELKRYFSETVSDFSVRLDDIRITVEGDTAEVAFDRTDRFKDRQTHSRVEKSIALNRTLRRDGPTWRMFLDGH